MVDDVTVTVLAPALKSNVPMTDAELIALKASIPNATNGTMNFFLILFSSSDSTEPRPGFLGAGLVGSHYLL